MLPRLFGLGDPAAYLDATGRAARVAVDTAYDRAGVHPDTPSTHLADAVGAVDFSQPTGSLDDALAEVAELYAHQTTAYHHPRYAAHLNCPVLLSSTAADTVLGALNTAVSPGTRPAPRRSWSSGSWPRSDAGAGSPRATASSPPEGRPPTCRP